MMSARARGCNIPFSWRNRGRRLRAPLPDGERRFRVYTSTVGSAARSGGR
jgi:hypothetical protein